MKPFLLLLCMIATLSASAQRIRFTDTSNKWSLLYFTDDPANQQAYSRYVADTAIAGNVYHQLITGTGSVFNTFAVREDTLQGKIYFRFVGGGSSTDTLEHLFFDYNLIVGDTLKTNYGTTHFSYVVQTLDSVRLGSDFYKHWIMSGGMVPYHFIEGIGTNHYPSYSAVPVFGLNGFQLRCFTNKGNRPACMPPIPLPFANFTPRSTFDFIAAKQFDNDSSCSISHAPVGVAEITTLAVPILSPNPGGREMTLAVPAAVSRGKLSIVDITGRSVAVIQLNSTALIPVGQYLSAPGMFYYALQDAATGQWYAGHFIFR